MNNLGLIRYLSKQLIAILILLSVLTSCKSDPDISDWINDGSLSISQYLNKNREEYSKFYKLLVEGKMLSTLYAYNPYGDDYTLFLPTNEAIDDFLQQNQKYANFEELLKDTSYIKVLLRYHTVNRKVYTDEFPDGAIIDQTLTGDRLVTGFYSNGNDKLIMVNSDAEIIKSNLKMTNGYIHVISKVLRKVEVSGYDWLQQQPDYSILAQAIELSGIKKRLSWSKYSIFAEPDSVYHRYGINNIDDLKKRFATPGIPLSNTTNPFFQFAAYHIMNGEYFLNDFYWGSKNYITFGGQLLTIYVGLEIKINTGVDTYGIKISESGDTTMINYIRPIAEKCNILTSTGAVHSISDLMYYEKMP